MNELEMAKALEGQFFWERTTKYEGDTNKHVVEIRKAQKALQPKPKKEIVLKEVVPPPKPVTASALNRINYLMELVASIFGIPKDLIMRPNRVSAVVKARHFFLWSVCRYYPDIKITRIGEIMGRHHSTIIHSRDKFESEKHMNEDLIAHLDNAMNWPG